MELILTQFDPQFASGLASLGQATQQYDPSSSNYNQFFNQYQADVTSEALKQMDTEAQKARNQFAGDATRGNTFGGGRYQVARGEFENNLQDIKSRRIFQDLAQNFDNNNRINNNKALTKTLDLLNLKDKSLSKEQVILVML